jgi:two-component system, chemotaxis family, chemotaxis protein CheY
MKILAVDDSPTMLEIISATLDEAGHSVLEAGNGAEAIKVMAAHQVDMIISDLNMVVMSGFELLHKVRENPVHMATPFVFLTTESDDDLKRAARSAGATAWIVKPFEPEALIKLVSQLGPS